MESAKKAMEIAKQYAKDDLAAIRLVTMAFNVCSSKVLIENVSEDLAVQAVVKNIAKKMRSAGIA